MRFVVHGFLLFCEWFFTNVSCDGRYFISPLRINGSALESIFSVLKHTSGGNLSSISYGPALGRLINRKKMSLTSNKCSEKGYRDISVNVDGHEESTVNHLEIPVQQSQRDVMAFNIPVEVCQSEIGGRQGSNACTIIAVKFGSYVFSHRLDISLLWKTLPQPWVGSMVNTICEGNALYDTLYGDSNVLLDVDDVVHSAGTECQVQSCDQLFGFNNLNNFSDLVTHIEGVQQSMAADSYGVIIACGKSVGLLIKRNGLCALIDSHRHMSGNCGAKIIMTRSPRVLINEYISMQCAENCIVNIGTLTWVVYSV